MLQIVKKIIIAPGVFHYWIEAARWRAALTWAVSRTKTTLGFRQPSGLKIKPRQAKYPVFVRWGASSDINIFHQIFALDECACVRNICIELHGADCRAVFLDALKDFRYDLKSSGELTISWNLQRKTPVPDQTKS